MRKELKLRVKELSSQKISTFYFFILLYDIKRNVTSNVWR